MILREVQRDQWHRILSLKRKVILQIADNLKSGGKLKGRDDIFFLKIKELETAINNKLTKEKIEELINQRRKKSSCFTRELPKFKVSKSRLKGIGVSTGVIKGRAVIMFTLEEMKKLKPGDILVTKIIDSSWTPIFNIISGLITEVGGMLSHGAVVARELGIPAVVGLDGATKRIRDNSMIEIDGRSGEVKRL